MLKIIQSAILSAILFVTGCATTPDNIQVVYNDPNAFRDYDCETLKQEINSLDDIIGREHKRLGSKASLDRFQAIASVLTILPLGFGTDGAGRSAEEEIAFGKLKGRAIGMRREAMRKLCAGTELYPEEVIAIENGDYEYKVSNKEYINSLMYPTLKSDEPFMP